MLPCMAAPANLQACTGHLTNLIHPGLSCYLLFTLGEQGTHQKCRPCNKERVRSPAYQACMHPLAASSSGTLSRSS